MDEQGNYGHWVMPLRDKKGFHGILEELILPEKKSAPEKPTKKYE